MANMKNYIPYLSDILRNGNMSKIKEIKIYKPASWGATICSIKRSTSKYNYSLFRNGIKINDVYVNRSIDGDKELHLGIGTYIKIKDEHYRSITTPIGCDVILELKRIEAPEANK